LSLLITLHLSSGSRQAKACSFQILTRITNER
jgi:hypothetical protein